MNIVYIYCTGIWSMVPRHGVEGGGGRNLMINIQSKRWIYVRFLFSIAIICNNFQCLYIIFVYYMLYIYRYIYVTHT